MQPMNDSSEEATTDEMGSIGQHRPLRVPGPGYIHSVLHQEQTLNTVNTAYISDPIISSKT